MNISEEKVEQRLRALFADERLDLPPPLDATKAIVEGAQRRRRRRRSMVTVTGVVVAAVVVSGGLAAFKIQSQDSAAVMSGGPPELSGRAPVTSGPLLAADGFGRLKLGMTEADVTTQGVTLTSKQSIAGCDLYDATGGGVPAAASVAISAANGLVIVTPTPVAHTPEGIGAGSTRDEILAAYSGAMDATGGVVAPVRSVSEYHFRLDAKGAVDQVSLYSTNQDCVG